MKTARDDTKTVPSLLDLTRAKAEVSNWVQEEAALNEGELPDWLEALQLEADEAVEQKLDRTRGFCNAQAREIALIEAEAEILALEVQRLKARATTRKNRIERAKRFVKLAMSAAGLKKVETPLGTTSWQYNGGNRPFEIVAPAEELLRHEETKGYVERVTPPTPAPFWQVNVDGLRKMLEAMGADELTVAVTVPPDEAGTEPLPPDTTLVKLAERTTRVVFK